ncbi:MAG TPA: S46 family peptidase [Kofleriaceae bacterium]|nr:S46 family peptidase [Kofleriaceae bacterium]
MKRNTLLCGLLLAAACGGGNKNTKTPVGAGAGDATGAGSATVVADSVQPPVETKPDPNLPNRLAHSNTGGMWLPAQMTLPQHVETFQKLGVAIDAKTLSDPLSAPLAAIVSLGGCSASFVSPEGLIVTNHHCVQGALQLNSTPQNNLVENGFLAKTKADEVTAGPTQKVMVLQAYKDVTTDMRKGLEAIKDPIARKTEAENRLKKLQTACEKDRPGVRCQVTSYFAGGQYSLLEYLEIRDVRLVYVPKRSVGNYGGEIDNWAWPRHTGDFSFYRAYVGKDGKPADFSKENVPFAPKHFLKVSAAGVKPADFVMVTGYPGRTERTATAAATHHDVDWYYPYIVQYLKERYAFVESHMKDAGETAIKANVAKQTVQNGLEKNEGVLNGLKKNAALLAQKDELERKIAAWAAKPGNEAYKKAITRFNALEAETFKTAQADFDRSVAFGGSRLLGTALTFIRLADERTKKDEARKPGFQERDMPRMEGGQKAFAKQYDRVLDRGAFRLALTRALKLPEAQRPWLATLLDAKKGVKIDEKLIDTTLDAWYAATTMEDEKVRMELLKSGTTAQLKASKDPFVQAAMRIFPIFKAEEKKTDKRAGESMMLQPMYVEAMRQVLGGFLSPDANSTLRVTYGTVKSFKPESKDKADWPFTVTSQIAAKDKGADPFDAPKEMLAAIKAKKYGKYAVAALDGEVPVDFLSDLDITGGNSGSATLNDKGELVGLAFDGTIEGVSSDVVFDGSTTRVIHADARYMLWVMDMLDNADHLIKEMGLTPTP